MKSTTSKLPDEMFFDLFVTLLFASCFVSASTKPDSVVLDDAFDEFVLQLCDALHVPGISLAVVQKHSFESKVCFTAPIHYEYP